MGRYCRICGRERPNEKFSGKGHRTHVCKDCARMPPAERKSIEQEKEIFGFLEQSQIFEKNAARLKSLASSENPRISELAEIVLKVAAAGPYRKRRLKVLAKQRKDLLEKLERTGLVPD